MPDREKVISELQAWIDDPYARDTAINPTLVHDALALLKEQEAVEPKSKVRHGANAQIQHFCGNCNSMLHGKPKFCSECGRSVKWEC